MIINRLKTLPRDLKLITRHGKSLLELQKIEKAGGSVGKLFDTVALKNPEKVAFYFKDEAWTFRKVYETSNKIGNLFAENGVKKGHVVSLFMENRPDYILFWLGLAKIGAVTALVNFNLRSIPLKHSFDLANAKAIICGYELADAFNDVYQNKDTKVPILYGTGKGDRQSLRSAIDLDKEITRLSPQTPTQQEETGFLDDLFYLYTSGTTGLPKAAVIKHSRFLMAGVAGSNANQIRQDDIIYATLPLYHTNSGILGASQTLIRGTTMALRDKFSASNFWKDCIKYNATAAQYMGEIMRYLLRQPPSPEEKQHKVRLMFGNGLRQEIWKEFVERFNIRQISEIYGATEGNVSFLNFDNTVGSCGFVPFLLRKMFPYAVIKLDKDGEPIRDPKTKLIVKCKPGEAGELVGQIHKDHPFRDFKGYASDKKANAKKVLFDVFSLGDSAFRTGDLFVCDELGYMYFKDRMGETYKWKGENVSTTEVEYVISNLTEKKNDVIVFPVKIPHTDGQAGQVCIADEENSINIDSLGDSIKKSLPSYAIPLFLRIVQEIEITGTHKMKKTSLQKEGYDINVIGEGSTYFWNKEKYIPLTKELYTKIISGEMNL